jgi:hypothetical protein
MYIKEIVTIIGIILVFLAYNKYIKDIYKGTTKPHLYSWIVFSVVTVIAFVAQLLNGGGIGTLITLFAGAYTVYITYLSIYFGTKDIKKVDKIFLLLALFSILPWILTNDSTYSVILLVIINSISYLPTIRKTLSAPTSESLYTYQLNTVRHFITLFALATYNISTYLYPLSLVMINLIVVLVILKKKIKKILW